MHSVRVFSQRAGGGEVEVTATPEQDVVALHLTNGPTLYLHAESARDLFLAQRPDGFSRGAAEANSGKIRIPAQLAWSHLEQAGGQDVRCAGDHSAQGCRGGDHAARFQR